MSTSNVWAKVHISTQTLSKDNKQQRTVWYRDKMKELTIWKNLSVFKNGVNSSIVDVLSTSLHFDKG